VLVSRELGIASVGLYTASVALSTIFVGFVLDSMSADFYPRLSAVANDHSEMNRMVNEQTEMALLLSMPAIIATIALAPLIMEIFFSAKFFGAVDVLRWQVLGMALKVVSWPMGFITLAKARRDVFIATETGYGLVNIGLLFLCIRRFGLVGAGMALFATYFIYIVVCCIVSYRLSGFRWSTASLCTLGSMTFAAGGAFAAVTCIESAVGMGIAACIASAVAAGSFIRLKILLNVNPLAIIRKRLGI
jgi:PST family polysaccharide transporter